MITPDAQKYSPYFHQVEKQSPNFVMDRSERLKNVTPVANSLCNSHKLTAVKNVELPTHHVCKNIP
jgi:hypothetical protein